MLAPARLFADGGTVQLRKEAGALLITVFTSPSPLSAGPADISVLLQKRNGLDPVLDADVAMRLRTDAPNTEIPEIHARPTRQQAQNKLLYAAPVTFSESGKWRLAVTISTTVCGRTQQEQSTSRRLPRRRSLTGATSRFRR